MKFLSDILAKAGLTVDGVVTLNNTATGQTPAANDNSTKLATTAWVRTFVQPYSLPIASASILGGIKVGTGLSIDSVTGVLSAVSAGAASIKSTQTFIATAGQTVFTISGGYTAGLIDVFLNGVYLSPNQTTATNGTTVTLSDAALVGDIIDVIIASPIYQGATITTDQLPEGVVNLYYTDARSRAAISLTVTGTSGASTYNSTTGVLNVPTYTLAGLGGVVSTRTITINGVTYDLTANRSWSALPVGGTAGQLLAKVDSTDYNAQWINEAPAASYTSQLKHVVKAGVAINKGQAVYVSSADGTNMIVSKASNATEGTSSKTLGLLETTASANGFANVITEGLLSGLDTTGANAAGDPVWLGTDGNLIYGLINKPSAPAHLVFIGVVTRRNANNGEIFVKVQNGFELGELHDYVQNGVQDNYVISYELSTSLYKPKSIATLLGYTPANAARTLTINGTAYDLSVDRSWSVGTVTSVAALTIGNTGTDITSTVANSTTTPVITLNVPDASAFARGVITTGTQTIAGGKYFSDNIAVGHTSPFDVSQFSLDINGGLLVKNSSKTAQFVLINSNPALGGNNAFVVHTVGGSSGTSYADIQGYYGTSIAGSTVLRLNPQGGNVLIGNLAGTGSRMVVASATGVLSTQAIQTLSDLSGVPTARTLTINGVTFDLSANRTWTINSMVYPSAGIAVSTGTAWATSITDNSSNWNTAFGWGNHASAGYATTTYVNTQVANLVASAPATLDTLNELAAALGNDASFSTTVSTALGNRLRVDIGTQGLTSTQQGYGRTNLGLGSLAVLSSVANAQITDVAWSKVTGAPAFITGYTEVDTLASVTGRGATTTAAIIVTASEGREVAVYMPSSYTTDDLVSGHEYGWYNDHWRLGMTRSGAAPGADFVIQWNAARKLSLTNGGNLTVTGTISSTNFSGTHSGSSSGTNTGDQTLSGLGGVPTSGYSFGTSFTLGTMYVGTGEQFTPTTLLGVYSNGYAYKFPVAGVQAWLGLGSLAYSSATIPTNNNQLTNGAGYITGYTETDTLQSVILRNGTTNTGFTITNTNDTYSTAASTNVPVIYLYNTGTTSTANAIIALRTNTATGGDPILSFDIGGVIGWSMGIDNSDSDKFKIARSWAALDSETRFSMALDGTANFTGNLTAANLSGTNTGDQTNISGNAATATNVAWTGVTGRPTALSLFTNDSGYITSSSGITGAAGKLSSRDIRIIAPNSENAAELRFGFTSWNNNNGSPYADYLHLRSYSDSSGGADNLVMFLKSGIGMRIWQQSWNSGTAYSSYVDVLHSSNYSSYAVPLSGGTMSGPLVVSGIDSAIKVQQDGTSVAWRGRMGSFNASSDTSSFLGNYTGRAGVFGHNNGLTAWADLWVNTLGIYGSGNLYLSWSTYVKGNGNDTNYAIWHAGNLTNLNQLSNGPGYITGYTETDTLASVTGRGASTSTAISINNTLTVTSGRIIARTGGVNTYGVFSGYDNSNHMMTFRASVTGSTDSPTFTAVHQTTFIEYAEANDTTGWFFKSASTGTYQEIARITRTGINWNGNTVIHSGNIGSYTAGAASSVAWGNVTSKPGDIMYYAGFTLDADTMPSNSTGFTYSVNAPLTGPIVKFSTGGGYDLQINAPYYWGNEMYFRVRNGDLGVWRGWKQLLNAETHAIASRMNQDVRTTDNVTFNALTVSANLGLPNNGVLVVNGETDAWGIRFRTTTSTTNLGGQLKNIIWSGGGALEGLAITGVGTGGAAMEIRNNGVVFVKDSFYNTNGNGTIQSGSTSLDGMLFDSSQRPALVARGTYPHIEIWSTVSNSNHGGTLRFSGYDNGSSGAYKSWNIGAPGSDLYFLDFSYGGASNSNPHAGIAGLGASYGYPGAFTIMRLHNNGNIGIGNFGTYGSLGDNTPAYKLDVRGNLSVRSTTVSSNTWGYAGQFIDTTSAASNYVPFSFVNQLGDHSWGIVARFHIATAGQDKPSIQFTSAGSNERWSIGYCTGSDFNFRITQNQGYRTDNSTNDGWGTPRFMIDTGGTLWANGVLNLGPDSGNDNGLTIRYGGGGYGRIRFNQDGSNHSTIHSFGSGWSGNNVATSGGCINLNGQTGVTFGAWNVPDGYIPTGGSAWFRYDVTAYSDARVKTDIVNIDNAISKIQSINGVTFTRTDKEDGRRYAGVIAQEVLDVLPEVVSQDELGMYSVSYGNMAGLFIEAIKEQQTQIESQKSEIEELKDLVKQLINR